MVLASSNVADFSHDVLVFMVAWRVWEMLTSPFLEAATLLCVACPLQAFAVLGHMQEEASHELLIRP